MSSAALAYLAAIVTIVMWSHAFVVIKYCLRSVTPWELVILRHVPAAAVFVVYWVVAARKAEFARMVRADGWRLFLVGVVAVIGYHFALNTGTQYISSGTTSVIVGMAPVFTFIVAALLIGERPTWLKAAGITLAFAGLYVCVRYGGGGKVEITYLLGAFIAMLSPVFAAVHTTLNRSLSQRHGAVNITAVTLVFGTLPLLTTVRPDLIEKLPSLSAWFWAGDLFLGLGCTAVAFVLWTFALGRLEATKVAAFMYFLPLLAILWGWLYLDETVTGWLVLGGAMVVAGVALTNRRGGRRGPATTETL